MYQGYAQSLKLKCRLRGGMEIKMGLAQKLFGTHSQHELKRIAPIADKVESYRDTIMMAYSDEELKGKTKEFKERLKRGNS